MLTDVDPAGIERPIVAATAALCCSQESVGGSLTHKGLATRAVNGAAGAGGTILAAATAEFSNVLRVAGFQS